MLAKNGHSQASVSTSPTILVVEDDLAILDVIKIVLQDQGYHVVTATNTDTLKKVTASLIPNLILLDIWLGKDNSAEVIKKYLDGLDPANRVPVVVMSADPGVELVSKKMGADGFLAKPFGIEELTNTVEKFT